ncbi:MAG: hypothetical protein LBD46_08845 [Endomicrobium sp.]|jgi:hypothetical protein|nr:hypothetical protein [Endomicrobium sp.]
MRKLFSFLAAAAVVSTLAVSAFAASTTTIFRAEISFASTNTNFGFTLKQMAGLVPAVGDISTTTVHWVNAFKELKPGNGDGITYSGSVPQTWFSNSKVYAEIDLGDGLAPNTTVIFYTDNKSGTESATGYKYVSGTSSNTASPLIAMKSTSAVSAPGLELAYKILHSSMASVAMSTAAADTKAYSAITSIDELKLLDAYGTYWVQDTSKPGYSKAAKELEIANDKGIRVGEENGVLHNVDVGNAFPGAKIYMFFSLSAFNAQTAHRYGTETLTVETITE